VKDVRMVKVNMKTEELIRKARLQSQATRIESERHNPWLLWCAFRGGRQLSLSVVPAVESGTTVVQPIVCTPSSRKCGSDTEQSNHPHQSAYPTIAV
jgi:hypothetical protein